MRIELSKEALQAFKKIYKEEFGVELTTEKLHEQALRFLIFFKRIYKPLKVNK